MQASGTAGSGNNEFYIQTLERKSAALQGMIVELQAIKQQL